MAENWRDEDKMNMTKKDRERFYARQRLEDTLVRALEGLARANTSLARADSEISIAQELVRKVLKRFNIRKEF